VSKKKGTKIMTRNKDDLLIGGFGKLAQNVDATGRMIRDNAHRFR